MSYSSRKSPLRIAAPSPTRVRGPLSSSFASNFLTRRLPTLVAAAGVLLASSCGLAWAAPAPAGMPYSWGANDYGQLGMGKYTRSELPGAVTGLPSDKTVVQMSTGSRHSIALCDDGTVYTWGDNNAGQLGLGGAENTENGTYNVPQQLTTLPTDAGKKVIQVAAGNHQSFAICEDGTVYSWGENENGQLGRSTSGTYSNIPGKVTGLPTAADKKIVQVATNVYHTLALSQDGTIYSWGYGSNGALGTGQPESSLTTKFHVIVTGGKKVIQVAAGDQISVALCEDGEVYNWGFNGNGELGTNDNSNRYEPTRVQGIPSITEVATGAEHTVALGADHKVYTWGPNYDGQSGRGYGATNAPGMVQGALSDKTVTQVVTGSHHTVVLCEDGSIYSWGLYDKDQLGRPDANNNGSTNDTPGLVNTGAALQGKKVTQLMESGSGDHTLVLAVPAAPSNTAPVLSGLSISPSNPKTNDELTATPDASDADAGDTLTYTYIWKKNGEPIADASGPTLNLATDDFGSKGDKITVEAVASDGTASSNSKTSNEVIILNSAPSFPRGTTLSLSPSSPTTGQTLTATRSADATDADGDSLTYEYKWFKNNIEIGGESGPTLDLSKDGNGDKNDVIKVEMVATDGSASSEPLLATSTATVANSAPVLPAGSVSLSPTNPNTDTTLTATASGTDADDADKDKLSYTYKWFKNGTLIAGQTGKTLNLATAGNGDVNDVITVAVTANDGSASSASLSSSPVTVLNSVPEAKGVTISPTNPVTGTDITANPTGEDLDGDSLTYTYQWYKNGNPIAGQTGKTLKLATAGNGDVGDVITVTATAHDGVASSEPVPSAPVTVLSATTSSSLIVSSVRINPSRPQTDSTLTAVVVATGPAGARLSYFYQWYKNGAPLAGETGRTLDLEKAGKGDRGDSLSVEVRVSDGTHQSAPVASPAVVVANAGPVANSLSLTPSNPKTNTLLKATATATDPDGDAIRFVYVWMKNGVKIVGEEGATLDLGKVGNGDTDDQISVLIKARDYSAASAPLTSATVTVVNSGPTMTSLSISPSNPSPTSIVTAHAVGVDADGDATRFLYLWYKNGVEIVGEKAATLDLSKLGTVDVGDQISVLAKIRDYSQASAPLTSAPVTVVGSPAGVSALRSSSPSAPSSAPSAPSPSPSGGNS